MVSKKAMGLPCEKVKGLSVELVTKSWVRPLCSVAIMVDGQCWARYLLAVSTTSELRSWGGVLPCMVTNFESPGSIVTFEGGAKEMDFALILNRLVLKLRVPSKSESVLVPKMRSMPIRLLTTWAAISNL